MAAYTMPPEWAPHVRSWMAWPSSGYTLGGTEEEIHEGRGAWAAVANAIVRFEPLCMLVEAKDVEVARRYLDSRVELVLAELNDAWVRDSGPTFVMNNEKKTVAAVNWIFNGWGQASWAKWDKDERVATHIAAHLSMERIDSPIVNEGGGIHVNGAGVVLLTETVQLGEGRNAGKPKAEIEAEIHRCLGTHRAIWLPRGLTRDNEEFGTRGHVDIVATFCNASTVLYHSQESPEHPDYEVSREVRDILLAEGLTVVPVPAPTVLRDEEGFVDYSYINHYLVNGGVILCGFNDARDATAVEIMQRAYPGREVVLVNAIPLFQRGGGIHCITQQQPAPSPSA